MLEYELRDLAITLLPAGERVRSMRPCSPEDPCTVCSQGTDPDPCGWLRTDDPGCVTPSCACSDCGTCNSKGSCHPRSDELDAGPALHPLAELRLALRQAIADGL